MRIVLYPAILTRMSGLSAIYISFTMKPLILFSQLAAFCLFIGCAVVSSESSAKAVQDAVRKHPEVSEYSLRVSVSGGTATLSGKVKNEVQSRIIQAIAGETAGISGVENQLQVQKPVSDGELKNEIYYALEGDSELDVDAVSVTVRDGVVTLDGSLRSHAAIDAVLSHVLNQAGVKDIKSNLTVNGQPYPVKY